MKSSTLTAVAGAIVLVSAQDIDLTDTADFNATSTSYKTNWSSVSCVAQDDFNTCLSNVTSTYDTCTSSCPSDEDDDYDNANDSSCPTYCQCKQTMATLNCALESCWNHVYGCDYQKTAMNLFLSCDMEPADSTDTGDEDEESEQAEIGQIYASFGIPYFPAPADAAGACSCNIPNAFTASQEEAIAAYSCDGGADTPENMTETCGCCGISGGYSAFYAICPGTDIASLQESFVINNLFPNTTYSTCDSSLSSTTCTDHGFPALPNNATFAVSSALPTSTGSLSDLVGQVTSPASGWSVTWSAVNTTYTITATSTILKAEASATSGTAKGSESATGKSGSGSSSGATQTATGMAGQRTGAVGAAVLGFAAVVAIL